MARGARRVAAVLRQALVHESVVDVENSLTDGSSFKDGCRLLSAYHLRDGTKIRVITEADRSTTTLLLPEEY